MQVGLLQNLYLINSCKSLGSVEALGNKQDISADALGS